MKTINVYSINELSEQAKQYAYEHWLNSGSNEWHWGNEALETLKQFSNIFPVKIKDYSIGDYNSYISWGFTSDMETEQLSGIRLLKYLWNNYKSELYKGRYYSVNSNKELKHKRVKSEKLSNGNIFNAYYSAIQLDHSCVLTGVCFDDDILQPIYEFMNKPDNSVTFEDLIQQCIDSFIKACETDIQFSQSMEYFVDHADANECEFTESGQII